MSTQPPSDTAKSSDDRERLPFEPASQRKKAKQSKAESSAPKQSSPKQSSPKQSSDRPSYKFAQPPKRSPSRSSSSSIPDVVSQRMVKRMALFCGVPVALGMSTFVASYFVVINGVFDLPTSAVVLVSMAFFGLSVLGLSYGVLSASWEEDAPGSLVGFDEFTQNFGRMTEAWRSAKRNSK